MALTRRLIDIGANLTGLWCNSEIYLLHKRSQYFVIILFKCLDPAFKGIYNGSQKHASDLAEVLKRAFDNGIHKVGNSLILFSKIKAPI